MNHYKVLKTEEEYRIALNRTIQIFHADPGTSEFEELELFILRNSTRSVFTKSDLKLKLFLKLIQQCYKW